MLKKTLKINNIITALYFIFLIALLVLPVLKYSVKYLYIIAASLPFMALYCMQKRKNLSVLYLFLVSLVLFFAFGFLMNTPLDVNSSINFSVVSYLCFLPYFMFDYSVSKKNEPEIKLIIILTLLLFAFIMVRTFIAFSVDPLVARRMAMGTNENEYVNELRSKNFGGFGFSYAVGTLIPYVAVKIMRSTGRSKFGFIVLFVMLFVYCILTQYTTLIMLAIVFSTIVFIKESKGFVTKLILTAIAVTIIISFTRIIGFLGNHIPLQELAYHFKLMYITLTTGEETTSRMYYMRRCFSLFRSHPFFGVNMLDSYNSYIVNHGHSTYIPILASHGLIGTGLYIGITVMFMKSIIAKLRSDKTLWIVFASYLVLGILNPNNSFEISVVVFLLIPLMEFYSMNKGEGEEEYV